MTQYFKPRAIRDTLLLWLFLTNTQGPIMHSSKDGILIRTHDLVIAIFDVNIYNHDSFARVSMHSGEMIPET